MRLPWLFVFCLPAPAAPSVRWIDEKGDIHAYELREVLEESPSEARVRLADDSPETIRMARVLDLVRERDEREEERALLAARRDVAQGVRLDAARPVLDRLAREGSPPWVREYATAARALLAERAGEEDAEARLRRFLDDHPRSRFVSDAIHALARARARAAGPQLTKAVAELRGAFERIGEIGGPIALRCRTLRDGAERVIETDPELFREYFGPAYEDLNAALGEGRDYGAFLLLQAEANWTWLMFYRRAAAEEEAAGRAPRGALQEVRKMDERAALDLPEVRSDIARELGRLQLACGDREGARGTLERARDLAPDPARRAAAEELIERLRAG